MKYKYKTIILFFVIAITGLCASLSWSENSSTFPKKELLESKIKKYSTKELLQYLSLDSINWQYEEYQNDIRFIIRDELVRRKQITPLIKAFENPLDEDQQLIVAQALFYIDDNKIAPTFKKHISSEINDTMYFCLNYLAKRGDKEALRILNVNYFHYGVSSAQRADTVQWFGKYKYRQAIPNLIDSLNAASLILVGASQKSLEQIFDGPHPDFKTIEEMKTYFENLYEKNR